MNVDGCSTSPVAVHIRFGNHFESILVGGTVTRGLQNFNDVRNGIVERGDGKGQILLLKLMTFVLKLCTPTSAKLFHGDKSILIQIYVQRRIASIFESFYNTHGYQRLEMLEIVLHASSSLCPPLS